MDRPFDPVLEVVELGSVASAEQHLRQHSPVLHGGHQLQSVLQGRPQVVHHLAMARQVFSLHEHALERLDDPGEFDAVLPEGDGGARGGDDRADEVGDGGDEGERLGEVQKGLPGSLTQVLGGVHHPAPLRDSAGGRGGRHPRRDAECRARARRRTDRRRPIRGRVQHIPGPVRSGGGRAARPPLGPRPATLRRLPRRTAEQRPSFS